MPLPLPCWSGYELCGGLGALPVDLELPLTEAHS